MTVPQMTVLRNAGTLLPKVALLTGVLALAPLAAVTAASPDAGSEASSATVMPETGRLGPVRRYDAQGTPKDVVLLVSDADGWDSRAEDVANAVAASGRTVLGVDLKTFQAGMDKTDDACSFPVNDLEAISQQIQKDLPFSQYRPPALAGIGAGAALAYAAITESLPNTFLAGIGLDFCPVYLAPRPFCPDAPTTDFSGRNGTIPVRRGRKGANAMGGDSEAGVSGGPDRRGSWTIPPRQSAWTFGLPSGAAPSPRHWTSSGSRDRRPE